MIALQKQMRAFKKNRVNPSTLSHILGVIPQAVIVFDLAAKNITYANAQACHLLQAITGERFSEDTILGQPLTLLQQNNNGLVFNPDQVPSEILTQINGEPYDLKLTALSVEKAKSDLVLMTLNLAADKVALEDMKEKYEAKAFASNVLETLPYAFMICDLTDFQIKQVNDYSHELFEKIQNSVSFDTDNVIGESLDTVFPELKDSKRMLQKPANLPYAMTMSLGGEYIQVKVYSLAQEEGFVTKGLVVWDIVTENVSAQNSNELFQEMVNKMPINIMMCNKDDLKINYINQTSKDTLASVQEHLPINVNDMLGTSIDVFHQHPQHQRKLLGDPNNLPHSAVITLGPEKLKLDISAVTNKKGEYQGPMLSWSIVTKSYNMSEDVKQVVSSLSQSSSEMSDSALQMRQTTQQAEELVSSVSAAAEEMRQSLAEISQQIIYATQITKEAVEESSKANDKVHELTKSAEEIDTFTGVISDIAEKTNLLALNATIEAARAGEAGKGFAVVAGEVKGLSQDTSKATMQIQDQINTIQEMTQTTVKSIQNVTSVIDKMNEVIAQISAALEEQNVTTTEVTSSISGVADVTKQVGGFSDKVADMTSDIKDQASSMGHSIKAFLQDVA